MKNKKNKGKGRKAFFISILGVLAITTGVLITFLPVTYKIDRSLVIQNPEYNVVRADGEYTSLAKTDASGNYLDDDFKIAAFTDMHLDTHKERGNVTIEMLMRNISSQKPDLVVLAGDNITSTFNERRT